MSEHLISRAQLLIQQDRYELAEQQLRLALGEDTAAIHEEFTRQALEAATGVPTVVGLRAHLDPDLVAVHPQT